MNVYIGALESEFGPFFFQQVLYCSHIDLLQLAFLKQFSVAIIAVNYSLGLGFCKLRISDFKPTKCMSKPTTEI